MNSSFTTMENAKWDKSAPINLKVSIKFCNWISGFVFWKTAIFQIFFRFGPQRVVYFGVPPDFLQCGILVAEDDPGEGAIKGFGGRTDRCQFLK
jgi:hypothetical protein